ncbi:unknown protein [Seminavis robusta]|uniref:Uncharacterized protein n=1 Tax=Seminavis robusta TaxID=568900 RepID=A0A9N8HRL9_9STRA|nr:unknown protein [Seminavis robusta]|eukprot:Sro1413_g270530.1 n/a (446) ;mRNA; r:1021-2358
MDAAAVRTLVQEAVQAAIEATRVPPPPPRVIPFAVTPAGAGNTAWDFTSSTGLKIFVASTAPFSKPYDGEEADLRDFLRKILHRAETYGWTQIFFIADGAGVIRNLTKEHGCLELTNVQAAAVTNLRGTGRPHQASECLRQLIIGSVTASIADKLYHRRANYTINAAAAAVDGNPPPAPIMKEDGTCMLYELTTLVSVETRATVAIITKKLSNLDMIMEEKKSNVEAFNAAVNDLVAALHARAATVPPMVTALFDGYSMCQDSIFVKYIARKQEEYEDGTINMTPERLMSLVLEKYKILVSKKAWMKKTEEEMEIMVLKAEISQLRKKPSASGSAQPKKATTPRQGKDDDKYAWKQVAPKDGEPHDKTVNGKEYIYCPHHETTKWVLKVNNKGIEHRTGYSKLKDSSTSGSSGTGSDGSMAAALANATEEIGSNTHQQEAVEENT